MSTHQGLNLPKKSYENKRSYNIVQKDLNGNMVNTFGSLCEANRSGLSRTCISRVLKGESKTYKNFIFEQI